MTTVGARAYDRPAHAADRADDEAVRTEPDDTPIFTRTVRDTNFVPDSDEHE